jgi:mycothiol synthase
MPSPRAHELGTNHLAMTLREVDASTAPVEDLLAVHAIEQACLPELLPGEPGRSADEAIAYLRHPPETHVRYRWLAETGGEPAGTAGMYVHGPTAVFVELFVAPDRRRQRFGTALLEVVLERASKLRLKRLYAQHATAGGAAFAARAGAADGQRDVRSLLDLGAARLPEPMVPDGWSLATWIGRVPDDAVESYARARGAMDDAPAPDGVDIPTETVERVRAMEASLALRRRELRVTVALDARGEVGSFTDLRLSEGSSVVYTDDTGTVAAARGLGLARAVKLESLRRLVADHPGTRHVTTTNGEENRAIRHINERIGFVPIATLTNAVLEL